MNGQFCLFQLHIRIMKETRPALLSIPLSPQQKTITGVTNLTLQR
jgi:hypothetical protein